MTSKRKVPKNPGYLLDNLTHRPFDGLKDRLKEERKKKAKR